MNVTTFFKVPRVRGRDQYAKARRAVYVRSQGRCEARCCPECTGQYEHAHHKRRRSQGGSDSASNLVAICGPCHEWCHRNPAEALALGLLKSGFEPAGVVSVTPAVKAYDWENE